MQATLDLLSTTPWFFYTTVGLLGLCVGSFLNVVIYRLPKMMEIQWKQECSLLLHPEQTLAPADKFNLMTPVSSCPHCQHEIRWYENIPLISWLCLRGKCGSCRAPISARYPMVELITMLASLMVAYSFGPTLTTVAGLMFTWVLVALTGIDFDTQLLPDSLTLPLAGLGLLVNTQQLFVSASTAIWGYTLGFMSLWIVYIIFKVVTGKEGMGYGDFKLLAALGAWLGPLMLPLIILISSLLGAIIGIVLLKIKKENQPFAFGPYLAIAGWIALIWGKPLLALYLGQYE